MKAKPCPKCKSVDLDIGDCGYSSFNVAWVRCKNCKLTAKVTGDSAVKEWNRWAKDPIGTLVKQVRGAAKEKRRLRNMAVALKKDTDVTVSEYAADLIDQMKRTK